MGKAFILASLLAGVVACAGARGGAAPDPAPVDGDAAGAAEPDARVADVTERLDGVGDIAEVGGGDVGPDARGGDTAAGGEADSALDGAGVADAAEAIDTAEAGDTGGSGDTAEAGDTAEVADTAEVSDGGALFEDCRNGQDDDLDGDTDCADSDCVGDALCDESDPVTYGEGSCLPGQGLDDDGDGLTDCADPDCADEEGCDEADAASYPAGCSDAADNDLDGLTDCEDPDCRLSSDCVEGGESCEDAYPLTLGSTFSGDTTGHLVKWGMAEGACRGLTGGVWGDSEDGGPEAVHRFTAPATGPYVVDLDVDPGPANAVAYAVTDCGDFSGSCLGGVSGSSTMVLWLEAGETCFIIVDNTGDSYFFGNYLPSLNRGVYELTVWAGVPSDNELECGDGVDSDGDGLTDCADPDCGADIACAEVCDDGIDNTGEGATDCDDPGCARSAACNEGVAGGLACAGGLDEDLDGLTDCYDPDCAGSAACPELLGGSCAHPTVLDLARGWVEISTCGHRDDFRVVSYLGRCAAEGDPFDVVSDVLVKMVAPAAGDYHIRIDEDLDLDPWTDGWGALFSVIDGEGGCPGRDVTSCLGTLEMPFMDSNSDWMLVHADHPGHVFYVLVDAHYEGCGAVRVYFSAWAPEAGRCGNGVDDDRDGQTDCADLECEGAPECDEASAAVSAPCHNGLDDDGDGAVDCGDADCRHLDPGGCAVPEGDECETAAVVTSLPSSLTVDTCTLTHTATLSRGHGCHPGVRREDLFIRFEAPSAGEYRVAVERETGGSVTLNVISDAEGCPTGLFDRCLVGAEGSGPVRLSFHADAPGEVFHLVAAPHLGGCDALTVEIEASVAEDDLARCQNGLDDDGDGLTDERDSRDCAALLSEAASGAGACEDQIDNDGNHRADCEDGSCIAAALGGCPDPLPGDSCRAPLPLGTSESVPIDFCPMHDVLTAHGGEGCHGVDPGDGRRDIVLRFEAPAAGRYRLDVDLPVTDGVIINLRDGSAGCQDGHYWGCLDSFAGSPLGLDFGAEAGQVFFIVIDSASVNDGCIAGRVAVFSPQVDERGLCGNGIDDDADGSVDCADRDCDDAPRCDEGLVAGACRNGIDDEGDGVTDCYDPDCFGAPECDEAAQGQGACGDGVDNDGDGRTDCDDAQCRILAGGGCAPPPVGDLCASPIVVPSLPFFDDSRDTCDFEADYTFSAQGWSPPGAAGGYSPDVVYRVVPDFTGILGVALTPAEPLNPPGAWFPQNEMRLDGATGCAGANLPGELARGRGQVFSDGAWHRGLPVVAGEPIYLYVGQIGEPDCGPFQIEIFELP